MMTLTPAERTLLRECALLMTRLGEELPPQPSVWNVSTSAGLESAALLTLPGDVIQLAPGVYQGNFILPPKEGGVRLKGPAELRSPSNVPVLQVNSYWTLENLTFTAASPTGDLVRIGTATQSVAEVPFSVKVENCQFLGDPELGQKRGLTVNGADIEVRACHFRDIKLKGQDSQGILGWNGPGPILIEDCHIEAAGENILFGGVDPSIEGLLVSDITIRGCTLRKPEEWRGEGWQCKNLLELKAALRVTIEDNLLENNWASAAGSGYAIWMKSTNQDGRQPWARVRDVVFANNDIRNVSGGISLHYGPQGPNIPMSHITLYGNKWEISRERMGGRGCFLYTVGVDDVVIEDNIVVNDGDVTIMTEGVISLRFNLRRNTLVDNLYGIKGAGTAEGAATLRHWFPEALISDNRITTASPHLYPDGFITSPPVASPS
jgi:hypothetical protein